MEKLGDNLMPAAQRGVVAGGFRCIPLLQTRTMTAPPASENGRAGAVNTGRYKAGWRTGPIATGVRIFNTQPYSGVIDLGRRASRVGPAGVRNLEMWARRKLRLTPADARSAAYAIAKTLAKRPLRARKVLTDAVDEMTELVMQEILHELQVELERVP